MKYENLSDTLVESTDTALFLLRLLYGNSVRFFAKPLKTLAIISKALKFLGFHKNQHPQIGCHFSKTPPRQDKKRG